jgi:hypothetical protein
MSEEFSNIYLMWYHGNKIKEGETAEEIALGTRILKQLSKSDVELSYHFGLGRVVLVRSKFIYYTTYQARERNGRVA